VMKSSSPPLRHLIWRWWRAHRWCNVCPSGDEEQLPEF
jgi:hypothetical protein